MVLSRVSLCCSMVWNPIFSDPTTGGGPEVQQYIYWRVGGGGRVHRGIRWVYRSCWLGRSLEIPAVSDKPMWGACEAILMDSPSLLSP